MFRDPTILYDPPYNQLYICQVIHVYYKLDYLFLHIFKIVGIIYSQIVF